MLNGKVVEVSKNEVKVTIASENGQQYTANGIMNPDLKVGKNVKFYCTGFWDKTAFVVQ